MLYFAYGSNMNPYQMKHRCPGAVPLASAKLENYRLVERTFADIEKAEGEVVYGALWACSKDNIVALDRYEGYPSMYGKHMVEVKLCSGYRSHLIGTFGVPDGKCLKALTYEMTPETKEQRDFVPYSGHYIQVCATGGEWFSLPVNGYRYPHLTPRDEAEKRWLEAMNQQTEEGMA